MKKFLLLVFIALSFNACKKEPITPDPPHYAVKYKMEGWKANISGYEAIAMKSLCGWQKYRYDTLLFKTHHVEFEYGLSEIPYENFKPLMFTYVRGADSAIFTILVEDTIYKRYIYR